MDYIYTVKTICSKMIPCASDTKIIFYVLSSLPRKISQTVTLLPHNTMAEFDSSVKSFISHESLLNLLTPPKEVSEPTPQIFPVQDLQKKEFKPKSRKKFFAKQPENPTLSSFSSNGICPIPPMTDDA